jgi:hypothetical protein
VLLVPGRNADLDLRVFAGKCGKSLGKEGAKGYIVLSPMLGQLMIVGHSQHAARATTEIAVVEVEAFALEDEGTDAIL